VGCLYRFRSWRIGLRTLRSVCAASVELSRAWSEELLQRLLRTPGRFATSLHQVGQMYADLVDTVKARAAMPDDDRFPRYLSPAWRKVLHCLQGSDPAERVSDAVTKALAGTIRAIHGVPSLASLAEQMRKAASSGDSPHFDSATGRQHVPTKIAERAASALAMTMQRELALVSPTEATLLLARRVIKDFAYHYGFDRMVQALPRDSYRQGDLRAVMTAALAGDGPAKLAARFASRPTGEGLRAPALRRPRRALAELLETDLESL
jgi:hypothetical protein